MVFGKRYNHYYIKYGGWLLIGILSLIVVDIGQLKVPELSRMVVNGMNTGVVEYDGMSIPFDMDFLLDEICRPLLIVVLLICVGRFLWRICFFGTSVKMEADLRFKMFDHGKDLSQQYYQVNKVGDLMSLYTNDLDTIQDCFGSGILFFADAAVLGIMSIVKMARMSATMTLFSMLPMVILFVLATFVGKSMMNKWEKRQEAFSGLSDFTQEAFSGIAVTKAFAKELKDLMSFKKLNRENEKTNVSFTKTSTLLNICFIFFVESVICVIIGYGGYLVYTGSFSAGELVEFISYFTTIIWPIEAVSMLIDMTARASASCKRVDRFMDAKIDVTDKEGISTVKRDIKGAIEFRNLTFSYPGSDRTILWDVSFKINAGENVGLIGRTGAGKTTIVDLMSHIYNIPNGSIFIDGEDINEIPIKELRNHLAYVPQDNFLFSDTISNNISFSMCEETEKESIYDAGKFAGVHDNIMEFKDGYETVLGERGVTVSGGQKQRISIARAFMKNAEIMILDDSVSAVDTKTERLILDNLKTRRKGKTTILIAHRITTVEGMDKIIFIDEGRVKAVGTHEELLKTSPEYAKMVEMQRLEDERKAEGLDA